MTYQKTTNGYILCFRRGEKLVEVLQNFAKAQNIHGAWLTGLGAAEQLKLGYYHINKKEYEFKVIDELVEITNLTGNFAYKNDELIVHIHGTFSRSDLSTIGGHVSELTVGGTCEINLKVTDKLTRQHNQEVGLNTLKLANE
ncbi:DNA-binding protein [Candidatus Saccharibacteria bacterium]|nr:DNA-binding protein [Candidatus Saccharibacteria bacterium]